MKQGSGCCCGCCCTALAAWKATRRQPLCRVRILVVAAVVAIVAMSCGSRRLQKNGLFVAGFGWRGAPYRRTSSLMTRSSRARVFKVLDKCRLCSSFDDLMDEVINNRHGIVSNNTAVDGGGGSGGAVAIASPATTTPNGQRNEWRKMSWPREIPEDTDSTPLPPSPVDVVMIRDRLVYIKRDDQVSMIYTICSSILPSNETHSL
jgi:hypothetical protein